MDFYIIDLERTKAFNKTCYWKQSKYGYTYDIEEAGTFDINTALKYSLNDFKRNTVFQPVGVRYGE